MQPGITVIKRNLNGEETWRYPGRVLQRAANYLVLEAFFDRDDRIFQGMPLLRGDRFIETYYIDRWYNIFEIHDRGDDSLRGWYCNIGYPAEIQMDIISYIDLALDLLVFTDGQQLVLDEDEYHALPLVPTVRAQADKALQELQELFAHRTGKN